MGTDTRRTSIGRGRFFDIENPSAPPLLSLFFVVYAAVVFPLVIAVLHPEHALAFAILLLSMFCGLALLPAGAWTNAVELERRWASSRVAERQQQVEATVRRLLGLTPKYAVVLSTGVAAVFLLGWVVDLPILVIYAVVGGMLSTIVGTFPLCVVAGLISGALLPPSLREDEPARLSTFVDRLSAPDVAAHLQCAGLGALLAASWLGALTIVL